LDLDSIVSRGFSKAASSYSKPKIERRAVDGGDRGRCFRDRTGGNVGRFAANLGTAR